MAARTPLSLGTLGGSSPVTSRRPPPATMVALGSRPMNDHRAQRSPCSTDSSRKPGSSPTPREKAATGGVVLDNRRDEPVGVVGDVGQVFFPGRDRRSDRHGAES